MDDDIDEQEENSNRNCAAGCSSTDDGNDTYTAPMAVGDTKFIKMAGEAIFIFRL